MLKSLVDIKLDQLGGNRVDGQDWFWHSTFSSAENAKQFADFLYQHAHTFKVKEQTDKVVVWR